MGDRIVVDRRALALVVEIANRRRDAELNAALAALVPTVDTVATRGPWVSVDEAARTLGVSERTVRRHAAAGVLPSRRLGRRLLIAGQAMSGQKRTGADTVPDSATGVRHGGVTGQQEKS